MNRNSMTAQREEHEFLECIVAPRLKALFARAREHFFPRWDSGHEWQIVAGRRKRFSGETGYCSSREKQLYIDPHQVQRMPDEGLLALIIHEICHDVASAHHTERWVKRMETAAKAAEQRFETELASQIRASAYCEIPLDKPWRDQWCTYLYHKMDRGRPR